MSRTTARPAWIAPVPNALTGLRLLLAVAMPFVPPGLWWAVVLAAGTSDLLDGWIARRFHAESPLGRLLDGIADKAFVFSAVLTMALAGRIAWWEGLVLMARDLVVAALASWSLARRRWGDFLRMRPRWAGKVTTALAFLWFLGLLLPLPPAWRQVLWALAGGASLAAAWDYLVQFRRARREEAVRGTTSPRA